MNSKTQKIVLFLSIGATALTTLIIIRQKQLAIKREQWFREWSDHMDATFKSNGLVKVGSNTWALPDRRGTNISGTNQISN
jgi:hypothetical protein